MKQIRKVTTPTKEEFLDSFFEAWKYTQGRPALLSAAILFAQFAFETNWGKACFNWNLGNVRAFKSYIDAGHDYFELPGAKEIVDGKEVVAGGFFRAFSSLAEGMQHHLDFLESLDRYRPAFEVLQEAANIEFSRENCRIYGERFVRALKAGGYFTGNLADYIRGVVSIAQSFDDLPDTVRESHVPPTILGPDPEFVGWGATNAQDILDRWEYDESHHIGWLASRYDQEAASA